ncbi:MAG: 2Fe-2S iron-sulfur cluster-binding protein [Gemmatimonadota bacterium]
MRVTFAGQRYELRPGESVLEGMARHGVGLPSACRAGACHTCLLRAESGDPGEAGQRGLKPSLAARGYFLACLARPPADLAVGAAGHDVMAPATVAGSRWLSPDVIALRLRPLRPVSFRAGQHVTLDRGDGVVRVFSIASLPGPRWPADVEFHVRVRRGGAMSGWLAGACGGTVLRVGAPAGDCFYLPGSPETALLLAGTGTGIAPLLAIARDALRSGHTGPVTVIHGAATPDRLYLGERLPAGLAAPAPAVRWLTCARSRGEEITDALLAELARGPGPARTRAFLCGGTRSVAIMRRALFLAGMSLRNIQADEFVPAVAAS